MKTTTALQGTALQKFGFVHVTGLPSADLFPMFSKGSSRETPIMGRRQEFGKWDINNGVFVVITTEGEVWLARTGEKTQRPNRHFDISSREGIANFTTPETEFENVLKSLCPNGEGVSVPCSNGQSIDGSLILGRLADPTDDFCGLYKPYQVVS